ncbi:peptidoglycan-binding domain-containing protein [Lusitaniella coriacea]|uniref:peptidoglycan-binding domain-containing protein n=1 Tax=Lusitaniella coriacea TaxID=1983105 RepID=UPI003CF84F37
MTANTQTTTTALFQKPILKHGSSGAEVVELQRLLAHWGYYYGLFDGIFNDIVEDAVKAYQHRVFLEEDGIVGPLTWKALYTGAPVNMPVLRRGSSGDAVRTLQNVLYLNGYYPYIIDGIFGPLTEVAVRSFQTDSGLVPDGIVGPRTWHALSKAYH